MWKRWVLPVGLGLVLGFAAWPSARKLRAEFRHAPAQPEYRRIYKHVAFMEWAKTHPHVDVLFLGDSLTDFWRDNQDLFDRSFPGAANFGVFADRVEDVEWRVDAGEVKAVRPHTIVLLVGVNNLLTGDSSGMVVEKIAHLVALLQHEQPDAKIILLGLLPTDQVPQPSEIGSINQRLAQIPVVTFLDFGPRLLNRDGTLNSAMQPDHLHLSPAGYQVWADALSPLL